MFESVISQLRLFWTFPGSLQRGCSKKDLFFDDTSIFGNQQPWYSRWLDILMQPNDGSTYVKDCQVLRWSNMIDINESMTVDFLLGLYIWIYGRNFSIFWFLYGVFFQKNSKTRKQNKFNKNVSANILIKNSTKNLQHPQNTSLPPTPRQPNENDDAKETPRQHFRCWWPQAAWRPSKYLRSRKPW